MKNYTQVIERYSKENKKKYVYTNLGLILIYVLFVTLIGTLYIFTSVLKENAYKRNGNYTVSIAGLNNESLNKIENNVEVKSYGVIKNSENNTVSGKREQINLFSLDKNSMENLLNQRIDLLQGRYPTKKNEIMITERVEKIFNKNVGANIRINKINYEIVGIYNIYHSHQPKIEGMTVNSNLNGVNEKNYLLVRLKQEKNVKKFVETIEKYNPGIRVGYNNSIMEYGKEKRRIIEINIIIDIFCIYLIYGTVNIRVRESKKDLMILRNIGCTKEKIMYMLFKRNLKLIIFTSIVGGIVGVLFLRCLIAPAILEIIRKMGGITHNVEVKKFYTLIFQIIILNIVAMIVSISEVRRMEKANRALEKRKKLKGFTNEKKRKKYSYFLALKNMNINKKDRKITIVAVSLIIIIFSLSASYYYLSLKNLQINKESGITIVKKYEANGTFELHRLLNYIKGIEGVGNIRAVGIVELKEKGYKNNNIVFQIANRREGSDGQLIVCSENNFKRLKGLMKKPDGGELSYNNEAILMENNYSEDYKLKKNDNIEVEKGNKKLKLRIIGSVKTENLRDFKKEKSIKKIRIMIPKSITGKNYAIFKDSISNVAISFGTDKISELNYYNIKNEALRLGMEFIDRTKGESQNKLFMKSSILLGYLGMAMIILIITINIINNEYILSESRKQEFSTMLLLGIDKKRLKKILILEGIVCWKQSCIYGGIISFIGITLEFILYNWKENIVGVMPPYWLIIIIVIAVFPINIIGKLLSIRNLEFRSLGDINRTEEEF